MEVLAEGASKEALTLATVFLGRGSLSAVRGIDSFADSAFSEIIFALSKRGTSSSSLELIKADMDSTKLKKPRKSKKNQKEKRNLRKRH
jgi:hypothetical protein